MNYKIQIPRYVNKGDWVKFKVSPPTRAFTVAVFETRTRKLVLVGQEGATADGEIDIKFHTGSWFRNSLKKGDYFVRVWAASESTGQGNMVTGPLTVS